MKILFIADVPLENPTSGSEQVLYQQATALANSGMEVYAITRQPGPPPFVNRNVDGVQEGCFQASSQDFVKSLFCLLKYPSRFFDQFNQDAPFRAAICHQPLNFMALLARAKLSQLPVLYVFHSPSHEEYLLANAHRARCRRAPQAQFRKIVERLCLRGTKKILVLSKYMSNKVKSLHKIAEDRIIVNPGGVDLDRFRPPRNRRHLKRSLGFPEGKVHLFTLRNLEPRMGLDNLLKCISILKDIKAGVHLVLGGEGIERPNLENLIKKYGLDDEVTMTGFIPPETLPQYYGAADFFILPTRSLEGFGLVTPESMACGTPVLGTPVGGTVEVLSNFDPQFLFRDTSPNAMAEGIQIAIKRFFVQSKEYDGLRSCCRRYAADNYSWKRHIDHLRSMLKELVRRPLRRGGNLL